ncbi:MAG TPA: lysophospholipase [Bacteroidales bacterium]|nr:lysophospholipase [Bacteroidales bacterium]
MKENNKSDGIKQYTFTASSTPESVILLVHGLGEHAGRYADWATLFNESGVEIRSFDLPGHGLSGGRRGVMPPFDTIYDLIDEFLSVINVERPGTPVFIYGHSLGGCIVLDYLIKRKPSVRGAIVTSPWIRLTAAPSKIKVASVKLLRHILPDLTSSSGLNSGHLSHNEAVCKEYANDPLVHDRISLRLFTEAENAAADIIKNAHTIELPLLIIHGRGDLITSPAGSVEVASSAPSALLKLWDDGYHELHNEPIREDHFSLIREWIETLI